jgi:xylulokinase
VVRRLALGVDLGTSAAKLVALDAAGRIAASGTAAFPTTTTLAGQAEQSPADWLQALAAAALVLRRDLATSAHAARPDEVVAVGLAGQLPTLVCLGREGPLGPAITWKDARADAWATQVVERAGRRRLYECTGMPVDGRYLGPMFRYHWHDRRADVETLLSAKDYIGYALTGRRVTDPSTAAGYGTYNLGSGAFDAALCGLWDLSPQLLPDVLPSSAVAGALHAAGAALLGLDAGVPVTVGAADSVTGALALTGLVQGTVAVTTGSSTIILDAVRGLHLDPGSRYLLTPHVAAGWYGREMDLLATGTGYEWLSRLLGWSPGELDARAARSVPGARGLVFAPYLAAGEQGALWNPALRGVLQGLTLEHCADDVARAFLEGVCFETRRCLDVLAESGAVRGIVAAGQMFAHGTNLQLLADVLSQPVRVFTAASSGAVGAALGAWRAVGDGPDRPDSARYTEPLAPGSSAHAYRVLYEDYCGRAGRAA